MKLEDRIEISIRLKNKESIREIGRKKNINHTTILREIQKHKTLVKNKKQIVTQYRTDEEIINTHPCELLRKSPYVCNACPRYISNHCSYHYIVYDATIAHGKYKKHKSKSNSKIPNKKEIIEDIQKALDLFQPISHIYSYLKEKYKEEMVSKITIYNWINSGILKYEKKQIKVKSNNNKKDKVEYKKRIELLKTKEYKDYLKYIEENDVETCEMDLLCGPIASEGYLMTLFIPRIQFLLAYKIKNKTPYEVVRVFDEIESKIGIKMFKKLFGVILTDRGSEFLRFKEIEYSKKILKQRTKIFYCDAGTPTQKPFIENIHRLVRRVYPKGTSFENVTQNELYDVVSNINSLKKEKYNNKTPNEMFIENFNKSLLNKLSLRECKYHEVVLKKTTCD